MDQGWIPRRESMEDSYVLRNQEGGQIWGLVPYDLGEKDILGVRSSDLISSS